MTSTEFNSLLTAAEAGDTTSMLEVALALRDGDGTESNPDDFFKWVNRAACNFG